MAASRILALAWLWTAPAPAWTQAGPAITSLVPDTAQAGGPGFTLTVNGVNFVLGASVRWNGSDRPTSFLSPVALQASIAAADIAAAGFVQVTVANPPPLGGTSAPAVFTVTAPPPPPPPPPGDNPVPAISSLSPASAAAGGPAFTLTVDGSGFVPGAAARWNGSDRATSFVASTRLRASIPASDIASAGEAQVRVFNPAPGGGLSNARTFTITASPPPPPPPPGDGLAPRLASLSPASAAPGGPGFTLTASGANFVPGAVVTWQGADRATAFLGSTQLRAAILASDIARAGAFAVRVRNPPGPNEGLSNPLTFTVGAGGAAGAEIRVFPNPWRPDLGVPVAFVGLPAGATVKLFTLSGRWVRTLAGNAGRADWDGSNASGARVASGIYYYLVTAADGSRSRGKVYVVR